MLTPRSTSAAAPAGAACASGTSTRMSGSHSRNFVFLTLVFRSIIVPVKAIILNLLSVGAAYGLLVLVMQKGVGNELREPTTRERADHARRTENKPYSPLDVART